MHPLPIGSVIKLKDSDKYIMITGWFQYDENKSNWDYSGCLYPQGIIEPNNILFNKEIIDHILFLGYQETIQMNYREMVLDYMKENFPDWDSTKNKINLN